MKENDISIKNEELQNLEKTKKKNINFNKNLESTFSSNIKLEK